MGGVFISQPAVQEGLAQKQLRGNIRRRALRRLGHAFV
jgi:hypothetical protein